jgi:hypothetical protein
MRVRPVVTLASSEELPTSDLEGTEPWISTVEPIEQR